MGSRIYMHKIHEDRLCELLEVDSKGFRKLIQRRDFPNAADSDEDGPFWMKDDVRQWLGSNRYRSRPVLRLDWWPEATAPAAYRGAELAHYRPSDTRPAAVLQHWTTSHGADVVVCWEMPGYHVHGSRVRRWAPDADAHLKIGRGWGIYGPDVFAISDDGESSDIEWPDLARALGRPAPFWVSDLRDPELITAWKPDTPTIRHPGVPDVDIDPLLRLAVLYPDEHPVHKTLIHYARVIHGKSAADQGVDAKLLREALENGRLTSDQLAMAAEGFPVPQVEMDELPETTRRIAWREVLNRDDVLAEQCAYTVLQWNGGEDMSHPHGIEIPRSRHGLEFLARLEPTTRTATFAILDPDREARAMVDPATDIPVAVPIDEDGRINALATNALPTVSPLAEIILEDPIWIRTADGTLYPAPYDSYYGLSWGYGGTGPQTLASLILALLNDITATGAEPGEQVVPDGLTELVEHKWPRGTVLTRTQLEAARDGRPELPPQAD